MDKKTVINNFSQYASSYDRYADVQNEAAGMLARMLPKDSVTDILEIGCGTGNYTALLKKIFKYAKIRAIDISEPMVKLARQKLNDDGVFFEVGDVEEVELGGAYDLITSNATLHWFNSLEGVIKKAERSLAESGLFLFSAFGPMTFSELRSSLGFASGENASITSDLFPGKRDIEGNLKKYFKNVKITERLIRESHPSLHELLKKIKYSGTRGHGAEIRKIWSPDLLSKIEKEYMGRFGSIEATYQVFFCEAKR